MHKVDQDALVSAQTLLAETFLNDNGVRPADLNVIGVAANAGSGEIDIVVLDPDKPGTSSLRSLAESLVDVPVTIK